MVLDVVNAAAELAPVFSGHLLRPGDATYEEARRVHNGLIDRRPALIARCRGVADVAALPMSPTRSASRKGSASRRPSAAAVTTWPGGRPSTAA